MTTAVLLLFRVSTSEDREKVSVEARKEKKKKGELSHRSELCVDETDSVQKYAQLASRLLCSPLASYSQVLRETMC